MEGNKKRPRDESNPDDEPEPIRPSPPAFISVIRGAMIAETIRGICLSLEPMIRRVVHDEVQSIILGPNPLYGNRQYYIENTIENPIKNPEPMPQEPRLKFIFTNQIPEQIYTGNQITDNLKTPLKIQLVDIATGAIWKNGEESSAKVRVVVIDGDLEEEGCDSDKFNSKIVSPRDGKPALLGGNTVIKLKQGIADLESIYFTDNSKWVRSGKFRLGVCVDSGTNSANGMQIIKEGLSKKFAVKDHRGELNEKHYPPSLEDETWRLEKIAKNGKFHRRLEKNGINKVQDLLRKYFANSNELQKDILEMPKNSWNKLMNHAKKCPVGDDSYLFRSEGNMITFNAAGEILEAFIDGTSYPYNALLPHKRDYVHHLASEAYEQWNQLEKVVHLPLYKNNNLPNEPSNVGYGNGGDLETDMSPSPNYFDSIFT